MRRTYAFLVSGLFLVTVFSLGTVDSRFDGSLPGVAVPLSDDAILEQNNAGCHQDEPGEIAFAHNATPFGPCVGTEYLTFSPDHTLLVCPDSCTVFSVGFEDDRWGWQLVVCSGPTVALIDWRDRDHVIPTENCAMQVIGDRLGGSLRWASYGWGGEGVRFSHSDEMPSLLLSMPPIG